MTEEDGCLLAGFDEARNRSAPSLGRLRPNPSAAEFSATCQAPRTAADVLTSLSTGEMPEEALQRPVRLPDLPGIHSRNFC